MPEPTTLDLARRVPPRALRGYAAGLGWLPVDGIDGGIAVYHRPDSRLHQVVVPTDTGLADYPEAVAEAVRILAAAEGRPAKDVLDHLLLPPADVLHFAESSAAAEDGSIPLDHAVRMVTGARRLLLAEAHSVIVPQAHHPRLSRGEAEEFVARCRFGQTARGSFVLNVACPLDAPVALPGLEPEPFARRVTELLMQSLAGLASAAESGRGDDLLDRGRTPGVSSNLFDALLMLRPDGDRASLTVSATWSRAGRPPFGGPPARVVLTAEVFDVAAHVAPQLRTLPDETAAQFLGYVKLLNGEPSPNDARPAGEVQFLLVDEESDTLVRARGVLGPDDYAVALGAHAASAPVTMRGVLRYLPRVNRVDAIAHFRRLDLSSPGA